MGSPTRAGNGLFGLVAASACALVVPTIAFVDGQSQQAQRGWQTGNNLLTIRVKCHKLIAREWAQKSDVNAAVSGDQSDPSNTDGLKATLAGSTILQNSQNPILADAGGRVVFSGAEENAASPVARQELQRCIAQKLDRILAFRYLDPSAAYGWICHNTHIFAIGAIAAVPDPGAQKPVQGWIFHFSQLAANADDPPLLHAFRTIRNELSLDGPAAPLLRFGAEGLSVMAAPVFSISEFEPPSAPWRLHQSVPWRELLLRYGVDVLVPWFILSCGLAVVGVLRFQTLRRGQQVDRRNSLTAPKAFRSPRWSGLPESSQPTPELAEVVPLLAGLQKANPTPLLVVLTPLIRAFDHSVSSSISAQTRLLALLAEGFAITFPAAMLCRSQELTDA